MSTLTHLVYSRRVGSFTQKSVLSFLSRMVDADGLAAVPNVIIAQQVECSKKTVIQALRGLERAGLVERTDRIPHRRGYIYGYRLIPSAIGSLPGFPGNCEGGPRS